jgi:hypothetical protein
LRIEWRTRGNGQDALLLIGDYGEAANTVMKTWPVDAPLLTDFLNDMARLESATVPLETTVDERDPQHSGKLALTRAQHGSNILEIDPEVYWDGIF